MRMQRSKRPPIRGSEEEARKERVMQMNASGPTLTPLTRTIVFKDFSSLSKDDVRKYDRMLEKFIRDGAVTCLNRNDYFKLMTVLRERRRLSILALDFKRCQALDDLIRISSEFFLENNMYKDKAELIQILEDQYSYEVNRLEEVYKKWTGVIEAMQKQFEDELSKLEEDYADQLYKYDTNVPTDLPIKFNKLSADLLDLREKEKYMLSAKRFVEAEEFHKEFERRKKIELNVKKEDYWVEYEKRRSELIKKHEKKINGLKTDWERKIKEKSYKQENEIKPIEKAVEYLQRKLTNAKSEYIGQDDQIPHEVVFPREHLTTNSTDPWIGFNSGHIVSQENVLLGGVKTRTMSKDTLVGTSRDINRPVENISNKQKAHTLHEEARVFEADRFPHKRTYYAK